MSGFPSGRPPGIAAAFVVLLALSPQAVLAAGADAKPSEAARRADIARGAAAAERCAKAGVAHRGLFELHRHRRRRCDR